MIKEYSINFIVQIFFDYDRPHVVLTRDWIKNRFDFFMQYTYPSLENQSFKDFTILLLCGDRNKAFTNSLPFPKKCVLVRDKGKEIYANMKTDYVSITRLDSDDLMHREAMMEVANVIKKHAEHLLTDKRECLIFRRNLQWNILNRFIKAHYRISPPFFTHIFPRKTFNNWDEFNKCHYMVHGKAGGRDPRTIELSKHKIMVTKHGENISLIRRGLVAPILSKNDRELEAVNDENVVLNQKKINKILKNFGVKND